MAVALGDFGRAIDLRHPASASQYRIIGAKTHGAAEVAALGALLQLIAFEPFGHQPYYWLGRLAEFRGIGVFDSAQVTRGFHDRHLHAEADSEIRHVPFARELCRLDLPFGAALSEPAGYKNAVNVFEKWCRIFALEHLGLDPVEIDLHFVGDAAVRQRFDQ